MLGKSFFDTSDKIDGKAAREREREKKKPIEPINEQAPQNSITLFLNLAARMFLLEWVHISEHEGGSKKKLITWL